MDCSGLTLEGTGLVATPALTNPIDLLAAQVDAEVLTLPTGARVFERDRPADSIYGVRRGIVEVLGEEGEKLCYRPGELFSYQDILWGQGFYRNTAVARTPIEVLRLDRLRFLNLLHNHPTLALLLIGQQHGRLREQRSSGTCCY
jgi:CRP-like cAMP-binding protein